MPGLEDLYREIILDHYRSPRNRGELPVPPAHVETGFNPLFCHFVLTFCLFAEVGKRRQFGWIEPGTSSLFASSAMIDSLRCLLLGGS